MVNKGGSTCVAFRRYAVFGLGNGGAGNFFTQGCIATFVGVGRHFRDRILRLWLMWKEPLPEAVRRCGERPTHVLGQGGRHLGVSRACGIWPREHSVVTGITLATGKSY